MKTAALVNDLFAMVPKRRRSVVGWTIAGLLFFWLQGKLIRFSLAESTPPPKWCPIDHLEDAQYFNGPLDPECVAFLKNKGILPADYRPSTARQR